MLSWKWRVALGGPLALMVSLGFQVLGTHQEGRDFSEADLRGSRWAGYHLHGADFHAADLSGADLHGADLSLATLSTANLRHADLTGANLTLANLSGADLTGARLDNVHLEDTVYDPRTRWPRGFRLPSMKPRQQRLAEMEQRLAEMEQRRRARRAHRSTRVYRDRSYFYGLPRKTAVSTPPARLGEE